MCYISLKLGCLPHACIIYVEAVELLIEMDDIMTTDSNCTICIVAIAAPERHLEHDSLLVYIEERMPLITPPLAVLCYGAPAERTNLHYHQLVQQQKGYCKIAVAENSASDQRSEELVTGHCVTTSFSQCRKKSLVTGLGK